jgi:uncharacterized protein YndB with AHSA1/START domain
LKTIIHVATIKKQPGDVFRALVTQSGLSSWWSTDVTADEHVGSLIRFRFLGDFHPEMQLVTSAEPSIVQWRCVGGHDNWRDNEFEFRLDEVRGGTRLKFRQTYSRELDDVQYGTYNFNWGYYLESLRLFCEEGKGKPFDPRAGRSG